MVRWANYFDEFQATSTTSANTSNMAWMDWNFAYVQDTSTATTSALTCNTQIWHAWNSGTTTTFSCATTVWVDWNSTYEKQCAPRRFVRLQPTAAEVAAGQAAVERRQAERLQHEAHARAEREVIEQRADALLQSILDEEQRAEYRTHRQFHVYTQSGKKYRVERGRSGNVKLLKDDGKVETSFCIHHRDALPTGDLMLHQKLLLEADEPQFLQIAKKSAA